MAQQKSNIFAIGRNPRTLFVIAAVTGLFGTYYWLAQSFPLPGSDALKERWGMQTTRRGVRGNRMHRPRASGPLDLTLLYGVSAFSLWKGLQARKQIQEQSK